MPATPAICFWPDCSIFMSWKDVTVTIATISGLGVLHVLLARAILSNFPRSGKVTRWHAALTAAFNLVAVVALIPVIWLGALEWCTLPAYDSLSVMDRLYIQSDHAQTLLRVMIAYQIHNITASLLLGEFCELAMMLHHIAVLSLSVFALHPFAQFYAPFFLGLVEASTIVLSVVNIFKANPALQKAYPHVNTVCRITFGLLFLVFRVVLWLPVSVRFGRDLVESFDSSPHNNFVVVAFSVGNVFLTALQLYWARLIARPVLKKFRFKGKPEHVPLLAEERVNRVKGS